MSGAEVHATYNENLLAPEQISELHAALQADLASLAEMDAEPEADAG
jgi:hypothetical protein